jgi:cytochrome c oxidase assembly protein subunit 15
MLTFVLTAVALLAVMWVFRLRRSRPDLWRAALVLAAGIPAQAALGGLTVLTGLNPWLVGAHFIVSAGLVSLATLFVLWTYDASPRSPTVARPRAWLGYAIAMFAAVTLVLGVVTTGAGPHAGDAATPRNGLDVEWLQHVHSYPAYAMLALTLALTAVVQRPGPDRLRLLVVGLLTLELGQVAIGITQARLGVPAVLVGAHMVVACLVVAAVTAVVAQLRRVT